MKHEDSKIHSNRLNVIFTLLYLPQKNWKRHFSIIKKPRQKKSLVVLTRASIQDRHVLLPNQVTSTKTVSQTLNR